MDNKPDYVSFAVKSASLTNTHQGMCRYVLARHILSIDIFLKLNLKCSITVSMVVTQLGVKKSKRFDSKDVYF